MSQKLEGPSNTVPATTEERNPQSARSVIARDQGISYAYRSQSLGNSGSSASPKIVTPVPELQERLRGLKLSKEVAPDASRIKKESGEGQIDPSVANSDFVESPASSQSFRLSGKSSSKSNQFLLKLRNSNS